MYTIVYQSTANLDLTTDDISSILKSSRDYNETHFISGCLIYHNHRFLQILEGDKTLLEELYSTIQKDQRHSDVKLLYKGVTREKTFKKWSMAFIDLSADHENTRERKLFKTNLIAYSEIVGRYEEASAVFWEEVKSLLD